MRTNTLSQFLYATIAMLVACTAYAGGPNDPAYGPNPFGGGYPDPDDPVGDPGLNIGRDPGCDKKLSDPIDFATGDVLETKTDLFVPGRGINVEFVRSYRSNTGLWALFSPNHRPIRMPALDSNGHVSAFRSGPLGRNWDHSYNIFLVDASPESHAVIALYNGRNKQDFYSLESAPFGQGTLATLSSGNTMTLLSDRAAAIMRITNVSGALKAELEVAGNTIYRFGSLALQSFSPTDDTNQPRKVAFLESIEDYYGNTVELHYDTSMRLDRITDTMCRDITFTYSGQSRQIATMTDSTGRTWTYAQYGQNESGGREGDLKSVTLPSVTNTSQWPIPSEHADASGTARVWRYEYWPAPTGMSETGQDVYWGIGGLSKIYAPGDTSPYVETLYDDPNDYTHWSEDTDFPIAQYYGPYTYLYRIGGGEAFIVDRVGNRTRLNFDTVNGNRAVLIRHRWLAGRVTPGTGGSFTTIGTKMHGSAGTSLDVFDTQYAHTAGFGDLTQATFPSGRTLKFVWDNLPTDPLMRGTLREIQGGIGGTAVETRSYNGDSPAGSGCGCSGIQANVVRNRLGHWYADTLNSTRTVRTVRTYAAPSSGSNNTLPTSDPVSEETYEYSSSTGQLVSHTLPKGDPSLDARVDHFTYYSLSECEGVSSGYLYTKVEDYGGSSHQNLTTTFEYNAVGNVTKQVDPNGNQRVTTFNQLGQVIVDETRAPVSEGSAVLSRVKIWYDLRGNRVRQDTWNLDGAGAEVAANAYWTTLNDYDSINRLVRTAVEVDAADVTATVRSCAPVASNAAFMITEYDYDGNDNGVAVRQGQPVASGGSTLPLPTRSRSVYDERNKLFLDIHGVGNEATATRYDYDDDGNLVSVSTGWKFDDSGFDPTAGGPSSVGVASRLSEEHTGDVATTATHYTAGYADQVTDGLGTSTYFTLDTLGRVTREETRQQVICAHSPVTTEMRYMSAQEHQYDSEGRRIATADLLIEYPATGCCNCTEPPTTRFWDRTFYWANGTVHQQSRDVAVPSTGSPSTLTTTYTYDTAYRVSLVTDWRGNQIKYQHDANGNTTGIITTEKRDALPPSTTPGADDHFATVRSFDAMNRLVRTADHLGNVSTFNYDSRGNKLLVTDPQGHQAEWEYDGLGRTRIFRKMRTESTSGPKIEVAIAYDSEGRVLGRRDGNGNWTTQEYDSFDRVNVIHMADGSSLSVTYDRGGNVASAIDASGTSTVLTYDALGRVTARNVTPASGSTVLTGAPGTSEEFYVYDALSRLVMATDDDTRVYRAYDTLSRLVQEDTIAIPGGLSYDPGDEPAFHVRTVTNSFVDGGAHLAFSTPSYTTYPSGRVVHRSFDLSGRTLAVASAEPENPTAGEHPIASMYYAGPDRLLRRDYGTPPSSSLPLRSVYAYTPGFTGTSFSEIDPGEPASELGFRTIKSITHRRPTPSGTSLPELSAVSFAWDGAQNKTSRRLTAPDCDIDTSDPLEWRYTYDGANRLIATELTGWGKLDRSETYTVDDVHNRTAMSFGGDPVFYQMLAGASEYDYAVNQYTRTPTQRLTYDANGDLTRSIDGCSADINGDAAVNTSDLTLFLLYMGQTPPNPRGDLNMDGVVNTNDLTTLLEQFGNTCDHSDYAYDYRNQLVRVSKVGASQTAVTEYIYDALGRRLAKVHAPGTSSSSYERLIYGGHSAWQLLETELPQPAFSDWLIKASYIYGDRGIDDPVSTRIVDDSGSTYVYNDYFYLNDDQGSVIALADASGAIVERYDYEEYGTPKFLTPCLELAGSGNGGTVTHSALGNPLLFQGRFYDDESGLYEFRTRYLEPRTGRFITRDSIGTWGDWNSLGNDTAFVSANPMSSTDAFGEFKSWVHEKVTREGLAATRMRSTAIDIVVKANIDQDDGNATNTGSFADPANHGDDGVPGITATLNRMGYRWSWIMQMKESHCGCNTVRGALRVVGKILHAVQDLYAHSTYVESADAAAGSMSAPGTIPLWQFFVPPGNAPNTPPGVTSGNYKWPFDNAPLPSHALLNKDGPSSPEGRIRNLNGWSMYDLAYDLSVRATKETWDELGFALDQQNSEFWRSVIGCTGGRTTHDPPSSSIMPQ